MNQSPQESKIVLAMIWVIIFFILNFGVRNALAIATAKEPPWHTVIVIDVLVAMVCLSFYLIIL